MTRLVFTVYFQRHFQEVHNINIVQPKAFGIVTGSKERKVVYPAELCIVEAGQFYRKKVPTELTKSVVDFATKSPEERLRIINSGIGLGQQGGLAAPVSDPIISMVDSIILIIYPRHLSIRHRLSSRMRV
jgi:hypothetical protein